MLCIKCNKKRAESDLPNLNNICSGCFLKIIEKRVRKYVRINKLFKKEDRVLITDDLSDYLIKRIIKDLPVKIFKRRFSLNKIIDKNKLVNGFLKKNKINKIIIPWTLDDEINLYLEKALFNENKLLKNNIKINGKIAMENFPLNKISINNINENYDKNKEKIIRLLVNVTDKEIELFSKLKRIRFKVNKKSKLVKEMLDNLEKKYPGVRFNSLRFVEKMQKY